MNNQYPSSYDTPVNTPQHQPQGEVKPRVPLFLVIITWLMLLGGIGRLLILLPLLSGGLAKSLLFPQILDAAIINTGLIITSFGLRRMRRWGLYAFSALTVLAVISSIYLLSTLLSRGAGEFGDDFILALLLVYFWAISKKFS